jgi:hypothetical protein
MKYKLILGAAVLLCCVTASYADMVVLNFEDLPDANLFSSGGQNIGGLYSGVTFGPYVTGLSVSRFGGYDNAAYPTHSGDVAVWSVFDNDTTLVFSVPQDSVSFWYTSLDPITLTAFDFGSGNLGSIVGAANTDGTTGTSSLLSITGSGIASVTISSSAGQYVFDDLEFGTDAGMPPVPEPSTLVLSITMLTVCGIFSRRRKQTR